MTCLYGVFGNHKVLGGLISEYRLAGAKRQFSAHAGVLARHRC
jgi:hypothetical protein